jgi:two-component system, NarL family, sensor kinase
VMVAQVSKEIRTISHLLHPPLLDVAGLCSAIRWYVDGFSERSHIKVDLDLAADLGRLTTDAEIAIFRVVQECLTNVYRHSGSGWCSLKLERQPDMLLLEIRDSGCGMPRPSNGVRPTGVGLRGMEERLRQLGGSLTIDSDADGTTIVAMLPVSEAECEGAA